MYMILHSAIYTAILQAKREKKTGLQVCLFVCFSPFLCTATWQIVITRTVERTDALYIVYSFLLTQDPIIYNTVPPGHLLSAQKGRPRPAWAPPNPLFHPHFCDCDIYRRADVGLLPLLPLAQDLCSLTTQSCSFRGGNRPDAAIVRIKKKHLRRKSPPLFALFYLLL